jgi:hypothetical protein
VCLIFDEATVCVCAVLVRPPFAPFNEIMSEVLHTLRPVVYVAARCLTDAPTWSSFLLSALADGTSRYLLGTLSALSPRQQMEAGRRIMLWGYYLFRSPLFERFTKIPLSFVLGLFGRLPLIGGVFANLWELAEELQSHWFYVSASS